MIAGSKSGGVGGPTAPPSPLSPDEVSSSKSNNKKSSGKPPSTPVPSPEELSPLKKAIKENESSIIESILSPTPTPNNSSSTTADGMTHLLDYLFEDGQLTRIEYDLIDQAIGIESVTEQAQTLLKILMMKDEEALSVLLEYLRNNRTSPSTSETIAKLSSSFLPARNRKYYLYSTSNNNNNNNSSNISSILGGKSGIGIREVIEATRRHSLNSRRNKNGIYSSGGGEGADSDDNDRISRVPFRVNLLGCIGSSGSSSKQGHHQQQHDFYYGRNLNQLPPKRKEGDSDQEPEVEKMESDGENKSDEEEEDDDGDHTDEDEWSWLGYMNNSGSELGQQHLEPPPKTSIADFRDFYLTDGCLETVRHLLLSSCPESLSASGWQRILKNMNGLLSTDVQPIKDLLLLNSNANYLRTISHKKSHVNWDQILYHSFQVWKRRNGLNSTFYSLIGLFQHSRLFQTADFLLSQKMAIQAKEHDKDPYSEENLVVDGNGNIFNKRLSSSSSSSSTPQSSSSSGGTLLERSDFLRKFYSPSKRRLSRALSTNQERVSVSPVLSLDLSQM